MQPADANQPMVELQTPRVSGQLAMNSMAQHRPVNASTTDVHMTPETTADVTPQALADRVTLFGHRAALAQRPLPVMGDHGI